MDVEQKALDVIVRVLIRRTGITWYTAIRQATDIINALAEAGLTLTQRQGPKPATART